MGSDARVYVFDTDQYVNEVVPAFRALLLNGELAPWLAPIARQRLGAAFDPGLFRGTDVLKYCTYLTPELAPQDFTAISEYKPYLEYWPRRACWSQECPAKTTCPFHKTGAEAVIAEDLNSLIEAAIVSRCLKDRETKSLFVGRTMSAADYAQLLDSFRVPSNHPVRELLKKLSTRGFVIGYRWGDSEGIHGWLDVNETRQLFSELRELPLPEYEPTLEAASCLLRISQEQGEVFRLDEDVHKRIVFHSKLGSSVQYGSFAPQDKERTDTLHREWLLLSLSFVRTVAAMAEGQAMGILWGNDLSFRS
jgi:hypothetical protein